MNFKGAHTRCNLVVRPGRKVWLDPTGSYRVWGDLGRMGNLEINRKAWLTTGSHREWGLEIYCQISFLLDSIL